MTNEDSHELLDESTLEAGSESSFSESGSLKLAKSSEVYDEDRSVLRSYYYAAVVSIIDKLFDVSILIRGASRNFRTSRAAAYIEKDAEGNDVLGNFKRIVSLKIKGLCPATPEWLVERLTEVVSMRRQQFYYQRAHRRHLGGTAQDGNDQVTLRNKGSTPLPKESQQFAAPISEKTVVTTKTYDTIATEFLPENDEAKTPMLAKIAPSEKRLRENIFPNPPKEPAGKAFECNQCFHMLAHETRKLALWRLEYFNHRLTR